MPCAARVILLIALLVPIGCASPPPLPADGPPPDFVFVYTQELPTRDSASGGGAGSPAAALPVSIHVAVDGSGRMDIEATYHVPHVKVEKSTHRLVGEQFRTLYDAILQADLFTVQDEWAGDDRNIGRETYFVLGNGRSRSITVVDRAVSDLASLRSAVHTCLPSLRPTSDEPRMTVIMDIRTKTFHAADDPHVARIPRQYRQEYPHPWAALDAGGQPCSKPAPSK